ncbi:unnamed protein product, partial [Amoebophrya sp. A25]
KAQQEEAGGAFVSRDELKSLVCGAINTQTQKQNARALLSGGNPWQVRKPFEKKKGKGKGKGKRGKDSNTSAGGWVEPA